jgi:hypothetical protein
MDKLERVDTGVVPSRSPATEKCALTDHRWPTCKGRAKVDRKRALRVGYVIQDPGGVPDDEAAALPVVEHEQGEEAGVGRGWPEATRAPYPWPSDETG